MQQRLYDKVVKKLLPKNSRLPQWLPVKVRYSIRKISGGDSVAAQMLRGLIWRYRTFISISLLSNAAASLFEGSTMAVLTIALEYIASGGEVSFEIPFLASVMQWIDNRYDVGGVFFSLVTIAVLMQISRSWLDFLAQSATASTRSWAEGDLRRRLFTQFTSVNYATVSKYKVGDLSSFISEVDRVGILITMSNLFISHLTIVLAYSVVLLWLSWQMTLIAIIGLLILSFSLQNIRKTIRERSKSFMMAYVSLNTKIVEFLSGIRLLHTFGRQRFARQIVHDTVGQSVRSRRQALMLNALVPAIVQSITIIGVAIFLGVGYVFIQSSGDLTLVPRLITFVFIVYRMLPRVTRMNTSLAQINEQLPFAARIANQLRKDDKAYLRSGAIPFFQLKDRIKFDSVSLQYPDTQQKAVRNLSFSIKRGQMIAIVGASGSGKSSIVNLLMRLFDPTEGHILVDNVPLQKLKIDMWIDGLGIVDQDTFVLHESVKENVRFGRLDALDEEIVAACKVANAHDFIMKLSNKYETVIGDRGHRLSGGQRQRLAIARAVLRDPDILILDEATSALDSTSERLIQQAIDSLRGERTILAIAHRLSTIVNADEILVLHNGIIAEKGTHRDLLSMKGRYYSMWQLQAST